MYHLFLDRVAASNEAPAAKAAAPAAADVQEAAAALATAGKEERINRRKTARLANQNLNALDENKQKDTQDLSLLNPLDAISQSLQNRNKAKASFLERIHPDYNPLQSTAVNVMNETLINMPDHISETARSTFGSEPRRRRTRTGTGRRGRRVTRD